MKRWAVRVLLLLGAAFFTAAVAGWALGIRFTLTPSIPVGLYQYTDEPLRTGRLATFCPPETAAEFALHRGYLRGGPCPGGVEPLGKYILAMAGDTVSITADGVRVNGQVVPRSAVYYRDRMGRELPHYPFGKHIVGEDSLFMFSGHHPRSFDSRYFGPIPSASVVSTAKPLWTSD